MKKRLIAIATTTLLLSNISFADLGCLKHLDERIHDASLILDSCRLTNQDMPKVVTYLQQNPQINYVYLDKNDIESDGIALLSRITSLVGIYASQNYSLGDAGVIALTRNPNLQFLAFNDDAITDAGAIALASLSKLQYLSINNASITDDGAIALAGLPDLVSLQLDGNIIGPKGAAAFATTPRLMTITISHNYIGDDGITALAKNPSVYEFIAEANHITDKGCANIASTTHTYPIYLGVDHNDITDIGVASLLSGNTKYKNLRLLGINFNHLSRKGIDLMEAQGLRFQAEGNDGEGAMGYKHMKLNKKALLADFHQIHRLDLPTRFHK